MGLTLAQMNAQHQAETELDAIEAEYGLVYHDKEEDDTYDPEAALTEAFDILSETMELLGYLGRLRRSVSPSDKSAMLDTAHKIASFLDDCGELESEEKHNG